MALPLLEPKATSQPPDWEELKGKRLDLAEALRGWRARWTRALFGCGGSPRPRLEGRRRPERLFCKLKICPECSTRAQKRNFAKFRPRAVRIMGPAGLAAFVTLTAPHLGALESRVNRMLAFMRGLIRRQSWKRPKVGLRFRVGLVWWFEIKLGSDAKGHPHLHVMVFASNQRDLDEGVQLLLSHWYQCFPNARVQPGAMIFMTSDPAEWGPRLHYSIRGTEIDPEWPAEVFEVAVMTLTSGKQHGAAIGLMREPRSKPATAPAHDGSGTVFKGNPRGATT